MRIFLVYSPCAPSDEGDRRRRERVRESWMWHLQRNPNLRLRAYVDHANPGPTTIRELFDFGCWNASPSDVVIYANLDAGLTTGALDAICHGVDRGLGVTICSRHSFKPKPGTMYSDVSKCERDFGIDVVACTPAWWRSAGSRVPAMRIGRGGWDVAFATVALNWTDGIPMKDPLDRKRIVDRRGHTGGVVWHEPHAPAWYVAWNAGKRDAYAMENFNLGTRFASEHGNPQRFLP